MSSYGDSFTVEKLEVKQQLNVKTYTNAQTSTPPTEGAEIGDVWITTGNSTPTNDGVWIYVQTSAGPPVVNGWVPCAQMAT